MDITQRVTVQADEADPALTTDALRGMGDQLVAMDDDGCQWVRGTVEVQPARPPRWWAPWRRPRLVTGALVEASAAVRRPRSATTPSMARTRPWRNGQNEAAGAGYPALAPPPDRPAGVEDWRSWRFDGERLVIPEPGSQEWTVERQGEWTVEAEPMPAPPAEDAETGNFPAVTDDTTQALPALTGARRGSRGAHRREG